ncbi:hypothetical protein D3C80_2153610 [compost metagenome]
MACVQNVEDAVGHHHFLAALARLRYRFFQLGLGHYTKAGFGAATNGVFQFDWRDGRGAQLTHYHTSGGVGQEA